MLGRDRRGGVEGAGQRAAVHGAKRDSGQHARQPLDLRAADVGERTVALALQPFLRVPAGLPVTDQVDAAQCERLSFNAAAVGSEVSEAGSSSAADGTAGAPGSADAGDAAKSASPGVAGVLVAVP